MELSAKSEGPHDPRFFTDVTCACCGTKEMRDEPPHIDNEPMCDDCYITQSQDALEKLVSITNDLVITRSNLKSAESLINDWQELSTAQERMIDRLNAALKNKAA